MFVPDVIAEHSYRAIGSSKPEKLARKKSKDILRRLKSVLTTSTIPRSFEISYVDWKKEVETSPEYIKQLDDVTKLFNNSKQFYNDTLEIVDAALESLWKWKMSGKGIDRSDILRMDGKDEAPYEKAAASSKAKDYDVIEGANYILKEYAFFLAIPSIYTDFDKFVFVYHKRWPVLENLINGVYDNNMQAASMGFFVLD